MSETGARHASYSHRSAAAAIITALGQARSRDIARLGSNRQQMRPLILGYKPSVFSLIDVEAMTVEEEALACIAFTIALTHETRCEPSVFNFIDAEVVTVEKALARIACCEPSVFNFINAELVTVEEALARCEPSVFKFIDAEVVTVEEALAHIAWTIIPEH
ncbi:hypothetical protein JKP88DRAFT_283878 [Tribonema minus]|uniref:Uncharacterized protein n=1 Tax=Tribonema minus TaxID=303371 RepID=A0A835YRA3_9STRA|nr:hypothetical protein JKP88DRAFT_283878 [Tribonema minus]